MAFRRRALVTLTIVVMGAAALVMWILHQRVELTMYRAVPSDSNAAIPITDDASRTDADTGIRAAPSIEIHRKAHEYEYALATVEFTDQGFFWNSAQLAKTTRYVRTQIDSGRGAIIVVFAHGWNNNAAPDNQNVACFEEVLKAVGMLQASYHGGDTRAAPAVVGVYLGWRGLVFRSVRLNQALTFWNRAKVADRIGNRGDLVETLLTMSKLRALDRRHTKLIIVGHSLGARAIFSGLSPFYNAAFLPRDNEVASATSPSPSNPIDDFADLVVLVNPAFSADQFLGLNRRLAHWSAPANTPPSLVLAGSVRDEATRLLYPRAYTFSPWTESFATGENADALRITAGNYPAFMTDTIEIRSGAPRAPTPSTGGRRCRNMSATDLDIVRRSRIGTGGLAAAANYDTISVFGSNASAVSTDIDYTMILRRFAPHRSVLAVAVDSRIIPSHSEIFTAPFTEFLTRVVNAKALLSRSSSALGASSSANAKVERRYR